MQDDTDEYKILSAGRWGVSEPFEIKRGLRLGETLSCDLFNILMEIIKLKAAVNTNKTISGKSYMLFRMLVTRHDMDITGRTMREVTSVFSKIDKVSAKVGLEVNEDERKRMISTYTASTRLD